MKKITKKDYNDFSEWMDFYHPPLIPMPDIPCCNHYGSYMVKRKFDVHTGVDLYAPVRSRVYAIEDGEVVSVRPFTGKIVGQDHWNNTYALDIEGYTGTICYGEIDYDEELKVGDRVEKGQIIGTVERVLKEFKGKATSMLHLAIHRHGFKYLLRDQNDKHMESFYDLQLDPRMLLIQMKYKAEIMMLKNQLEYHKKVLTGEEKYPFLERGGLDEQA